MKTVFCWLIQFYRWFISPMLGPRCRFFPTCSVYALEALEQHSLDYALWLIVKRLGRCQPWGGSGYDPVPTPDKQCSKKDYQKRMTLSLLSHSLSCHCCAADRQSMHSLGFRSDQNGHQDHKFTPYTSPPPHHHHVYL
jgi:putative membrane protein insertion efficiency factor